MYLPIGKKFAGVAHEKEGGIEIPVFSFLLDPWNKDINKTQPYWLVHELAHAYHDRTIGLDSKSVKAAYKNAMENVLYNNVETKNLGWNDRIELKKQPAYARKNHREYFAELSVAYLAENSTFPYTADDLRKHDPKGYELMKEVWGEKLEPKKK
jgi:hypothetical protein